MAFIQRSATETFVFQNGPFGRVVTEPGALSIWSKIPKIPVRG